ncbi:kinase [Alteromonas sp. C1M14]|uniref:kinase n=1 Tax=Alteromonas sp. C1M14 TaxID=2841567 RepID=UPI001C08EB20|nr:kinase [Alteromonas sp. C1M14]MBU2976777.1 kinase [Alteromonas sp. C1M14]
MDLKGFLTEHQLPASYADIAQKWFVPLARDIASHQSGAKGPFFVGINGCQGSGKSTVCDFLVHALSAEYGLTAVTLSLDDFYLSSQERASLSNQIHPLLKTRGVPGTHDTQLADNTFKALIAGQAVALPRFDKSTDNPLPQDQWPVISTPVDVVLVEGWCWGVPPESADALETPINQLEANEDPDGHWRRYVNQQLTTEYQSLFDYMDFWVMLKGPSFERVYQWRCEQEHKLAIKKGHTGAGIMSDGEVLRFIQHYQRLTEHAFSTLPAKCHRVFELDGQRNIVNLIKAN